MDDYARGYLDGLKKAMAFAQRESDDIKRDIPLAPAHGAMRLRSKCATAEAIVADIAHEIEVNHG